MEQGDLLVVTKLDRLGRDAINVSLTVEKLAGMAHARAKGRKPGRHVVLSPDRRQEVRDRFENGETVGHREKYANKPPDDHPGER